MSEQLAAIAAVIMLVVVGGLISHLDVSPSIRTKQLRRVIGELDKLAANNTGQMTWRVADAEGFGPERSLSFNLVYLWHQDDATIELIIKQRHKVSASIVLTLGDNGMPTWEYGPKTSKKIDQLLPDLRQVLGENEIKVVAAPDAA